MFVPAHFHSKKVRREVLRDGQKFMEDVIENITIGPKPGMSYLEFDFQKDKVDLMGVQRYLASRCWLLEKEQAPASVPVQASAINMQANTSLLEGYLNWIGGDAVEINASEAQTQLEKAQLLLEGEQVTSAFKNGRDSFIFTNSRVLRIDVEGWSGKRVAYVSIPYGSIRAFSVQSAGFWDRDTELKIYTKNKWNLNLVTQDFRKGKADIIAINSYLSHMTMGLERQDTAGNDNYSTLLRAACAPVPRTTMPFPAFPEDYVPAGGVTGFLSWLGEDHQQIDSKAVQKRLTEETLILLPDEVVQAAFKCGRDMHVHTNKRVMKIDGKLWSAKQIEYLSIPLQFISGYQIRTAGSWDLDSEVTLFTSESRVDLDLAKGKANVEEYWRVIQNTVGDTI
jgi:hypothetical protein